jgi:hypothetical protein
MHVRHAATHATTTVTLPSITPPTRLMYESLDGRSAIDLAQKFKRLVKSDKAADASAPHRQQERAQRGASAFKAAAATASAATTSTGGNANGDADMDNDDDDEFTVPRTGRDQRAHSRVLAVTASKHPQKLGAVESLMERARQRVAEAAGNSATATTMTGQRVARVRDDKERAPRAVAVSSTSRRPERLKFTKEEEDRLTTLVGVHGNQWACVMQPPFVVVCSGIRMWHVDGITRTFHSFNSAPNWLPLHSLSRLLLSLPSSPNAPSSFACILH